MSVWNIHDIENSHFCLRFFIMDVSGNILVEKTTITPLPVVVFLFNLANITEASQTELLSGYSQASDQNSVFVAVTR
jgi:hypothetical protein